MVTADHETGGLTLVDGDLKEGKIVEKGTHKELLEQQGAYKEMYMTQKNLENYGLEQEASA